MFFFPRRYGFRILHNVDGHMEHVDVKSKVLIKNKNRQEKAIIDQHFLAKLQFCCRYGKLRENGSNTGQRRFEEGAFHKGIRGIENKIKMYKMKGYF